MPAIQPPTIANDPDTILTALAPTTTPVLLFGAPGTGKSVLMERLAVACEQRGQSCLCLSADPGAPAFGLPGTVSVGEWRRGAWHVLQQEGLCTLDAGRFRLPLILALQALLSRHRDERLLLVDGPGVVRGVAGRETLSALCQLLQRPRILALARNPAAIPLPDELAAWAGPIWHLPPASAARRPGARTRARARTAIWDAWLAGAQERVLDLATLPVLGTPPPRDEPAAWNGRQIALLGGAGTLTLGEAQHLEDERLTLRIPRTTAPIRALLVRDAQRRADGLLGSAEPFVSLQPVVVNAPTARPPTSDSPPLSGRCGPLDYTLINGVFGDPLLHLRIRHAGRSLLFDLGDPGPLSARLAHQVSDVFISHAHMDHLAGFQWLLRSRLGDFPPCRIYGPPGLARHIAGFLDSFLWDRIGERGPVFDVAELHGDRLRRYRLQAGHAGMTPLPDRPAPDGQLWQEPGFRIRATVLDHLTPVLAFAFEPAREIHVRRDRLEAAGLAPGPWLGHLKQAVMNNALSAAIDLPDGRRQAAGELADRLLLIRPGKRLVYATDLADTPDNRQRLIRLARHAHTFVCESPFRARDAEHARRNGHLTTTACADIAAAADVGLLVPFHFSRRYQHEVAEVFDELQAAFPRLNRPPSTASES